MSLRGYGAQPFATGPFPFGPQEQSAAPAPPALFSPVTNDRDINANASVSATVQRVQLVLASFVGKSMIRPEFGIKMPEFVRQRIQEEMEESVKRALEQMIVDGEISVSRVLTEAEGSRVYLVVDYVDETTGQPLQERNEITRNR